MSGLIVTVSNICDELYAETVLLCCATQRSNVLQLLQLTGSYAFVAMHFEQGVGTGVHPVYWDHHSIDHSWKKADSTYGCPLV